MAVRGPEAFQPLQVKPQDQALRPGVPQPLQDRPADPEGALHGDHRPVLLGPDCDGIVRPPGGDLEPGGLSFRRIPVITQGGEAEDGECGEENEETLRIGHSV